MEIDWSKAPEGATHANPDDQPSIWRLVCGGESWFWNSTKAEWVSLHPEAFKKHFHRYVAKPINFDDAQEIRHIIANALMIGGDPAVALVAHGYRKFEIVEEDAQ